DWPGNVRELRNCAERFVLLGKLGEFSLENNVSQSGLSLSEQVSDFEKMLIEQALTANEGRINETMLQLQVARKTLYDKMQKFGLDKRDYKDEG
ncbi:sigma-54-dependent Fis family transcriptional regulator, partial [Vibrio campbellii]|uniref:helix-turn-helix domain-containing protein n=2 Tax=Vibrio TaxID=662 RepID=UPI003D14BEA3